MEDLILDLDGKSKIIKITPEHLINSGDELTTSRKYLHGISNKDVFTRIRGIVDNCEVPISKVNMWAVDNSDRYMPGISVNGQLEQIKGVGHISAIQFNRFMTEFIMGTDDNGRLGKISFSFHQKGIEVVYGTHVTMCENLCIMGGEHVYTYGQNKLTLDRIFEILSYWISTYVKRRLRDDQMITRLNEHVVNSNEVESFIGDLFMRAQLKNTGTKIWAPLNVSQLGNVVRPIANNATEEENMLNYKIDNLWDLYNAMTNVQKINNVDMTILFDQNKTGFELLKHRFQPDFTDIEMLDLMPNK